MYPFVEKRKISYIVLASFILMGILFIFGNSLLRHGAVSLDKGFNLGIQFSGGTEIRYQMPDANFDIKKATNAIKEVIKKDVTVQESSSYDQSAKKVNFMVVRVSSGNKLTTDEISLVKTTLQKAGFSSLENEEITNITASMGAEYMLKGLLAILISILLILLYIAVRFSTISGWSAGLIASVTIIFDALVMISIYSIFYITLNESFIAGLLTVIGYSINDKIIIFDRIRENARLRKKGNYIEMVNTSIRQTLTRSINTTATALLSVIVVYVMALYFKLGSLQEFCFPLIIGIAFTCLSSIFIAAPMLGAYMEANAHQRKRA